MRFTSFTASYSFIPACQVKAKIYQESVLQALTLLLAGLRAGQQLLE